MKYGIDVSKWQGDIAWQDAAADGVRFAMIRLGYGTQSGAVRDPKFRKNVEGALDAGIEVGVYFYGTAVTGDAARAEARFVLSELEPYRGRIAYPVAYDVEDRAQSALPRGALTAVVSAFCDAIRQANWYPMYYSSKYWLEQKLRPEEIHADVWLAQWAEEVSYAGKYGLWQHGNRGKIRGIAGNVDLDIAYTDYPAIIQNGGFNGYTKDAVFAAVPDWAEESVRWAVENGILRGGPDGFMTDAVCTRLELCVFLKRFYDLTQG